MANSDKVKIEQDATRVIRWLAEHRAVFEQTGIDETTLSGSVGLAETEITQAVDHLENHEAVVRFPHASTTPPSVILKPGRGWADLLKKVAEAGRATNS